MNADQTDELEQKKDLVKREIVDQGLTEDFEDYIKKTVSSEGINLGNWTMDEIVNIIRKFKQEYAAQSEREKQNSNENLVDVTEQLNIQNELPEQPKVKNPNYIITKKQEPTKLTNLVNLSIEITKFEKISRGLFSNIEFTIEVPEINSKAKRTFSEFEWLKKTIEKWYPQVYVPPLPKLPYFRRYTDNYLNKKSRYLSRFLNSLGQNILIRSTKLFLGFITDNEDEFKDVVEEYHQGEPPSTIKKYFTLEGKICIAADTQKEIQADKIRDSITKREEAYFELNEKIKEIIAEFKVVSGKMEDLSKAFGKMKDVYDDNAFISSKYDNFKEITSQWSKDYVKQSEMFQYDLKEFFKYERIYTKVLTNFYDEFEKSKYDFMEKYLQYDSINNISKRDQKNLNGLRKRYGFTLNRLLSEYNILNNQIMVNDFKRLLNLINTKKDLFYQDYSKLIDLISIENKINEIEN